jgi:flagellin
MRINTNVSSLAAQRSLAMNKRNQNDNLRKLSTGLRITRAADDAAGLAISEKFKAYIRSTRQAKRNAGDSISMIQTAEGGLGEVSSILIRMRELSIQAASDTIGSPERNYTDVEYQELKNEIQRISKATSFNGKTLLDGKSGVLEFQIGQRNDPLLDRISFDFSQANATAMALGIDSSSLGTKVGAQQSISVLDDALIRVNGIRAKMGAAQNRLQSVINNLSITDENMSEANSRVRDIDVASETAKLAKNNILVQSGVSVLSQTNNSPSIALKLLG